MAELSQVEVGLGSLVDAVVSFVGHNEVAKDVQVLPIGGFLWKFPSEGNNRVGSTIKIHPPPAPQIREYPRKCGQCDECWVSDWEFELDHLRRCSVVTHIDIPEDNKQKATNLGVARRVWCEVGGSFSRLDWRYDRDIDACSTNFITFTEIAKVSMLDEPANSFEIITHDCRTVVFQWRAESEAIIPYHLVLDARQWQEYLDALSKYARNSPLSDSATLSVGELAASGKSNNWSVADVFNEFSHLLLTESSAYVTSGVLESELNSILHKSGYASSLWSLHDNNGNSLVHLAINLNLGDRTATIVSALLNVGIDTNLQNYEGESSLLLVAASGDVTTATVLLTAPSIQVNLSCALGVTAFHVAANAGDVNMMQILCDAGAQPEKRDDNNWTALHYAAACSAGHDALHFLCELLSDEFIDAQCCEGNTALHVAAGCGCLENVRALLETAASPHINNCSGETAYHLALRNNHIQCAVAINEYQSMLPISYTVLTSYLSNESEEVPNTWGNEQEMRDKGGEWVEGLTEDGFTYYYNIATGESSWYKSGEYQLPDEQVSMPYKEGISASTNEMICEDDMNHSYSLDVDEAGNILGDSAGLQLPLCLIPMVSPLTSLDDPTAAAKYEAARRRARKQRRRRQSTLQSIHGPEDTIFELPTNEACTLYEKY